MGDITPNLKYAHLPLQAQLKHLPVIKHDIPEEEKTIKRLSHNSKGYEIQFIKLAEEFRAETPTKGVLEEDEERQQHERSKEETGSWETLKRGCHGSQVTAWQSCSCLKWKSSQTSSLSLSPPSLSPPPPLQMLSSGIWSGDTWDGESDNILT